MPPHAPPLVVAAWARHADDGAETLVTGFLGRLFPLTPGAKALPQPGSQEWSGLVLATLSRLFGPQFAVGMECEACEEDYEVSLDPSQALTHDDGGWTPRSWTGPTELTLSLVCPSCGEAQDTPLDTEALLAHALHAEAHRLTAQVAALGAAFGWPPDVTLGLSEAERDRYLDLARPG